MSHDQPTVIVDSGASYMGLQLQQKVLELVLQKAALEKELVEAGHMIGVLREKVCQQQAEIEALKVKYRQEFEYVEKKFSDEWWQGVEEFNKKAQEK